MVVPAGAIVGVVVGAAFASEASRRGARQEKREREDRVKELEETLAVEVQKNETSEKATKLLEMAKIALERKIEELEKTVSAKGKEAAKEKESRERLVTSLKARVKTVMDAISESSMDNDVLVKIMQNLLSEDLFADKQSAPTDENSLAVSEHGNVTVKNTLASPNRMLRLGSNKAKVFEDSTNKAASGGGARFRIPFFSRQEQKLEAQKLFLSARSEHKPSGKKLSIAAAAPEGQVSDRKPEPSDEIGSKADAACIVSPGKETLIFKSQGQKRTKQKQSEKQRFRIALFDGGRKQNKGEAKKRTNKAVVKKRQEVEYEDHPNFGSTIVIRSHDI